MAVLLPVLATGDVNPEVFVDVVLLCGSRAFEFMKGEMFSKFHKI